MLPAEAVNVSRTPVPDPPEGDTLTHEIFSATVQSTFESIVIEALLPFPDPRLTDDGPVMYGVGGVTSIERGTPPSH